MAHIFDRIGGDDTVRAAVDLFYDKVLDDPSLVGYFDGVDIPHLRVHQRAFISAALGGPEEYSGPSIRSWIHAFSAASETCTNSTPSVFVTASAPPVSPATVFPLGLQRLYCWVRNSALPQGAVSITFNWTKDQPNGFLYQFSLARQRSAYTGAYYFVPQVAGTYRCDIIVNGQPFGSAHFSRAP